MYATTRRAVHGNLLSSALSIDSFCHSLHRLDWSHSASISCTRSSRIFALSTAIRKDHLRYRLRLPPRRTASTVSCTFAQRAALVCQISSAFANRASTFASPPIPLCMHAWSRCWCVTALTHDLHAHLVSQPGNVVQVITGGSAIVRADFCRRVETDFLQVGMVVSRFALSLPSKPLSSCSASIDRESTYVFSSRCARRRRRSAQLERILVSAWRFHQTICPFYRKAIFSSRTLLPACFSHSLRAHKSSASSSRKSATRSTRSHRI